MTWPLWLQSRLWTKGPKFLAFPAPRRSSSAHITPPLLLQLFSLFKPVARNNVTWILRLNSKDCLPFPNLWKWTELRESPKANCNRLHWTFSPGSGFEVETNKQTKVSWWKETRKKIHKTRRCWIPSHTQDTSGVSHTWLSPVFLGGKGLCSSEQRQPVRGQASAHYLSATAGTLPHSVFTAHFWD